MSQLSSVKTLYFHLGWKAFLGDNLLAAALAVLALASSFTIFLQPVVAGAAVLYALDLVHRSPNTRPFVISAFGLVYMLAIAFANINYGFAGCEFSDFAHKLPWVFDQHLIHDLCKVEY